jgi:hypothetical protein
MRTRRERRDRHRPRAARLLDAWPDGGIVEGDKIFHHAEDRNLHWLGEQAEAIRRLGRNVVRNILEIGARLREARNALYHGEWERWLDVEFGWSNRTARRYMSAAKAFADKTDIVSELPIDIGALYLLARPRTPPEVRRQAIERAQLGERITAAVAVEFVRTFGGPSSTAAPAIACSICGARPYPELGSPGTREDFDLRKFTFNGRPARRGAAGEWRCSLHPPDPSTPHLVSAAVRPQVPWPLIRDCVEAEIDKVVKPFSWHHDRAKAIAAIMLQTDRPKAVKLTRALIEALAGENLRRRFDEIV